MMDYDLEALTLIASSSITLANLTIVDEEERETIPYTYMGERQPISSNCGLW
jgi:hypothetical protein